MRLARARLSAILRPLLLLALTYTLYTHFRPSPPSDAAFGLLPFPDYTRNDHFRPYADPDYEAAVDTALVALETAARASTPTNVAQYPVRRIWQTAGDEPERTADARDWEHKNPEWDYQLITDAEADVLVASPAFSSIPRLGDIWRAYPRPVLRTDLLRYLLTWRYGGLYADIDVIPKLPVEACAPLASIFSPSSSTQNQQAPSPNISLVLGLEIDEPSASPATKRAWRWSRTSSFAQYILYAPRPFSPLLRRAIVRTLAHSAYQHRMTAHLSGAVHIGPVYTKGDVLEATGPGMLTDAVLDVLGETLPAEGPSGIVRASRDVAEKARHAAAVAGEAPPSWLAEHVTWAPFHGIREPVILDAVEVAGPSEHGGLIVLPINVWSSGQGHSGADPEWTGPESCLNHRFAGRWKHSWIDWVMGIGS